MQVEVSQTLKYTEQRFNPKATQELMKQEKYANFHKWCQKNGIIYESIQTPGCFGPNGVVGVVATEYIPANKAVLCVPNKLIITKSKIQKSELRDLIAQNPKIFSEKIYQSNEFNQFVVFLIYEKLKGKNSFFYEYLEILQENPFTMLTWREEELLETEDIHLIAESMNFNDEMKVQMGNIHQLILDNPEMFPREKVTLKMMVWAYETVMTRIFGWSLPSSCMIPFADMFNHSGDIPVDHYLIDLRQEREFLKEQDPEKRQAYLKNSQYKIKSDKIDFSLLKDDLLRRDYKPRYQTSDPWNKDRYKYVKKYHSYLEDSEGLNVKDIDQLKCSIEKINQKRLEKDDKYVWQLRWFQSSDSEDNDTDEEVRERYKLKIKKLHEKEIAQIKSVKKLGQKIKNNQENDDAEEGEESEFSDEMDEFQLSSGDEYSDSEYFTSETEWDWFEDSSDDIYFIMNTDKEYQPGEQLFNCYGSRTNKFLLLWYGFTMADNKYDSFNFRIWLSRENMKLSNDIFQKIVIHDFIDKFMRISGSIEKKGQKIPLDQLTQEFRLKRSQLDTELILNLRLFLLNHYSGSDLGHIMVTIPVSINFEIFMFKFAIHLALYCLGKFMRSSVEDCERLFNEELQIKERFCLVYKMSQKEILNEQIKMFRNSIKFLEIYKENPDVKQACQVYLKKEESHIQDLVKLRYYLKTLFYSKIKGYFKGDFKSK